MSFPPLYLLENHEQFTDEGVKRQEYDNGEAKNSVGKSGE